MSEYIRRQDAIELCNNPLSEQSMRLVPPADVVPVVHSRWKYKCGEIQCLECGNRIHRIDFSGCLNFCPNCGAKMDGDE